MKTGERSGRSGQTMPAVGRRQKGVAGRLRRHPEAALIPLVFVVVVVGWELITRGLEVPSFILPPPSEIVASLSRQIQTSLYWEHLLVTTQETLLGYMLGCSIAFFLGVLISQVALLEKVLFPYIVGFETVPKIALAPLFVIWFGFGTLPKIVMSGLVCFFPMLVNVIDGLRSASPDQIDMLRSLGATRRQVFLKVKLPNSLPFVFAALDVGIVLAIIGAVVGEFVGARAGLGYQLLQFNFQFNTPGVFALLATLSVMGLTGHFLVRGLQKRFAFWSRPGYGATM
jgi:NitT/TauT family transport system permease protein